MTKNIFHVKGNVNIYITLHQLADGTLVQDINSVKEYKEANKHNK